MPISDVWLDELEHLLRSLIDLEENSIVDLEETEELKNFAGFRGDLVDTRAQRLGALP